MGRAFPSHHQSSDDDRVSTDTSISDKPPRRRHGSRRSQSSWSGSDSDGTRSSGGRRKKKDGFSSKIQIPKFGGKKGHPHDVANAFRQWACCITYYHDYYEDSYLMPLVVSSLTGDASDVFDWILSLNPGNTQDLTTLLQMLREHYCGSLTFREQRNTIKNLHQKPQEAAIDFLIRVGTSVSNLGKDWKDKLMDKELQSVQYEVSLNGVQEEIRHILDSEIAKNGGKLTPQQMYEAVKRYETYVAHNKRLAGKGISLSASQQKVIGHTLGYKPRFHRTTAFAATIAESEDDDPCHHESSSQVRVSACPPANRRSLVTPWVTSHDSIEPQLLLPQLLSLRMTTLATMSPLLRKEPTPLELSHLKRMMKGCSFPATWRRLYPMILSCR